METLIDSVIDKMAKELNDKREAILKERIQNIAGAGSVNLIEEASKRFPRIKCEVGENGAEVWYWNDGSIYGIRLLTIEPCKNVEWFNNDSYKFGWKIY